MVGNFIDHMMETPGRTPVLTESEALVLLPLLSGAAAMTSAWLADAAGLTIRPTPVYLSMLAAAGAWAGIALGRTAWRVDVSSTRLAGVLLLVAGFIAYLCRLAWPALLPISEGPDVVHHLSLINYIQQRHALPHGHLLGAYLGEMDGYPPGSHLIAALVAGVFGADGLHVLYPLTTAAVALKAGLIYNLLLRVFPAGRRSVAAALAGSLLLLVPHAYLLRSFTYFYFYAQVMSETFAVAMFWAVVAWDDQPSARWLLLFACLGIAVLLCWPVWLPAPVLALAITVLAQRARSLAERARDLALALGPIAIVLIAYWALHAGSTGILASGGSTVVLRANLFGWPFLTLVAGGVVVVSRRRAVPLFAFSAACLVQIAGLVALQWALGATNFYLAQKTVHLLVCPMVVFAGVALEAGWHALPRFYPDSGLPGFGRRRLEWVLPAVVAASVWHSDLPKRPLRSPITEPVYRAGVWAKAHVPAACVDYLVPHWLTGYWLHIDVLGNPRQSERMRRETFDYEVIVGHWIEPGSLQFGIAGDVDALPVDMRGNIRVLQRFGPAAVLERVDGHGRCTDDTPPIDQVDDAGVRIR